MTRSKRGEPDLPPGPARDLVDLFRRLRHSSPKTNRQIAPVARVSPGHLSEVLRGWKAPSPQTACRIAAALGADQQTIRRSGYWAEQLAELNRYHGRRERIVSRRPNGFGADVSSDHLAVQLPEFRIGPLRVPCRIIEGDGERAIERSRVRVLVNPVTVQLPPQLAQSRAEIEAEQAHRREAGDDWCWNGPRYAVEDLVIERDGPEEHPGITLILKHSDYYTFMATQRLDYRLPGGATLRTLYLDGRDPREVPDFMRSSFGLNVALISADNWLVVSHRSQRIGVGRGLWNSTANEGLARNGDSVNGVPPDLFRATQRGIQKELRLPPDQYELRMLAFSEVTSMAQWAALFRARLTSMTRKDFEDQISRGIEDGWEHRQFDYVAFTPTSVLRYLLREDRLPHWAPTAPVLFYLSLVNVYGKRSVDQAADRILRELELSPRDHGRSPPLSGRWASKIES